MRFSPRKPSPPSKRKKTSLTPLTWFAVARETFERSSWKLVDRLGRSVPNEGARAPPGSPLLELVELPTKKLKKLLKKKLQSSKRVSKRVSKSLRAGQRVVQRVVPRVVPRVTRNRKKTASQSLCGTNLNS